MLVLEDLGLVVEKRSRYTEVTEAIAQMSEDTLVRMIRSRVRRQPLGIFLVLSLLGQGIYLDSGLILGSMKTYLSG